MNSFILYTLKFYKVKDFFLNLKWFLRNLWLFKAQLWDWRPWDSKYQMDLFAFGLEQLKKEMENGHEERTSANKKIAACEELIHQLRRDIDTELVWDSTLETIDSWSQRYNAARMLRFDEIHRLMKGQCPFDYKPTISNSDGHNSWVEWFDGTGIEGWWD